MTVEQKVENLVKAAEDYAKLAIEDLIAVPFGQMLIEPEAQLKFSALERALRLRFLFPNLSDEERELLSRLSDTQTQFSRGMRQLANGDDDSRIATRTTRLELRFMDLKRIVLECGIMEKVTGIQDLLLQKEFLSVTFPEY